jgi:hypothetical protein
MPVPRIRDMFALAEPVAHFFNGLLGQVLYTFITFLSVLIPFIFEATLSLGRPKHCISFGTY